jgi:hypothetical protein
VCRLEVHNEYVESLIYEWIDKGIEPRTFRPQVIALSVNHSVWAPGLFLVRPCLYVNSDSERLNEILHHLQQGDPSVTVLLPKNP